MEKVTEDREENGQKIQVTKDVKKEKLIKIISDNPNLPTANKEALLKKLTTKEDKEEYKAYLLANVKAYFDQAEQKLSTNVEEPYSSEYEKVKEKYKQFEQPSSQQIAESLTYYKVLKILTNGKQVI